MNVGIQTMMLHPSTLPRRRVSYPVYSDASLRQDTCGSSLGGKCASGQFSEQRAIHMKTTSVGADADTSHDEIKKDPHVVFQIELPTESSGESNPIHEKTISPKLQKQLVFWKEVDEYFIIALFVFTVAIDSLALMYSRRDDQSEKYDPSEYTWFLIYAITSNTVSIFVLICEKLYEKREGTKRFAWMLLGMRRLFAVATFCHLSCGLYYVAVFLGMPNFLGNNTI